MGKEKEPSKAVASDKAWPCLTHGVLQSVNYTAGWSFSEKEGPVIAPSDQPVIGCPWGKECNPQASPD